MNQQLMKRSLLLTLLISFLTLQYACSQQISQWRGTDRDGIYYETGLLEEWPDDGPKLLWSLDGLDKGYSSVTIAHNAIYFTGINDTVDMLIAVDFNGNIKWQTPYGTAWPGSFPDSRCTPTIENERIYLSSGNGDVACIHAISGEKIWDRKASKEFEGTYGRWGISESPLIVDNKVFYTPGGNITTMIAIDKLTGETIWTSESLEDEPAYVSPLLVNWNGKQMIVNLTKNFVFGIDPDHGEILWTYNYGEISNDQGWNIQINTPLFHQGELFITNGYDHKSVMLKLEEDLSSVSVKYIDSTLDVHHGGVVRIGDYVYGANWEHNRMGRWVCMHWNTGEIMYESEWHNKGSIIAANNMLYCYDEKDGNIALVKADPEAFRVISSFQVPLGTGPHWSHLVINDGILYVRHEEALMAYDINDRKN